MDPQAPPPPPYAPPPAQQPGQWGPGAPPPQVPYTPMPQQQPPAKKRPNFVPLIVLIVIVGVIAGAYWLFRDNLSGNVFELRVGDCIDLPNTDEAVSEVQHQPCTTAHDAEVFLNITDPTAAGQPFPGSESFKNQVIATCVPAASQYLGASFDTLTALDVGWFRPTSDSWDEKNDRGITCYLYKVDESKLNKTLKGVGASPI